MPFVEIRHSDNNEPRRTKKQESRKTNLETTDKIIEIKNNMNFSSCKIF